jgi:hypothetical protein
VVLTGLRFSTVTAKKHLKLSLSMASLEPS